MVEDLLLKARQLFQSYAADYGAIAVAFSGGVDSSVVLRLAAETGAKTTAVTARTKLHPAGEADAAADLAAAIGTDWLAVDIDELDEAGIENNPLNRCYLCKRAIFQKIKNAAAEKTGAAKIIFLDGTNADDLKAYRPGLKALKELGIKSPLAELGLNKAAVVEAARRFGLPTADKPAAPCLITRLPYGAKVDYALLKKIDAGEKFIRSLGFYNVRLRVHGDLARLEIDKKDLAKAAAQSETITANLKPLGFKFVTLDLAGFRSGSFDE